MAPCPVMDTKEDLQGSQDTKGPLSKKQHRVKEEYLEEFMLAGSQSPKRGRLLPDLGHKRGLTSPPSVTRSGLPEEEYQVMWGRGWGGGRALLKLPLARGPRQIYDIKTLHIEICHSQSADS